MKRKIDYIKGKKGGEIAKKVPKLVINIEKTNKNMKSRDLSP